MLIKFTWTTFTIPTTPKTGQRQEKLFPLFENQGWNSLKNVPLHNAEDEGSYSSRLFVFDCGCFRPFAEVITQCHNVSITLHGLFKRTYEVNSNLN